MMNPARVGCLLKFIADILELNFFICPKKQFPVIFGFIIDGDVV